MSYLIKIDGVFDSLTNNDDAAAKKFAEDAKEDIKTLVRMKDELQEPGITALGMVKNIINNVLCGHIKSAKAELKNEMLKEGYLDLQNLLKAKKHQNIDRTHEQEPGFSYSQHQQHIPSESSQQMSPNLHQHAIDQSNVSGHLPSHQAEKSAIQEKPLTLKEKPSALKEKPSALKENQSTGEFFKIERDKKASKAMHVNNPDIADLSDINRPTKLAEKFSELYDNEWTEVFDILNSKKRLPERIIIDELLLIVQDAYIFCKDEADKEIKTMCLKCLKIIGGRENEAEMELTENDLSLMKELRKANAELALPRLEATDELM